MITVLIDDISPKPPKSHIVPTGDKRCLFFRLGAKYTAMLVLKNKVVQCGGDTEEQAIKNVLNACRIGSMNDRRFMRFCEKNMTKVQVVEV